MLECSTDWICTYVVVDIVWTIVISSLWTWRIWEQFRIRIFYKAQKNITKLLQHFHSLFIWISWYIYKYVTFQQSESYNFMWDYKLWNINFEYCNSRRSDTCKNNNSSKWKSGNGTESKYCRNPQRLCSYVLIHFRSWCIEPIWYLYKYVTFQHC